MVDDKIICKDCHQVLHEGYDADTHMCHLGDIAQIVADRIMDGVDEEQQGE